MACNQDQCTSLVQCVQSFTKGTLKFDPMFTLRRGHRTKFQTLAVGRVGPLRSLCVGWVGCLWSLCGGWDLIGIRPLRCSIWQDRPCKILLRIQDGAECGKRSEIELLFALRTRTVRDIKANFPTQYGSILTCELCQVAVCCQKHL